MMPQIIGFSKTYDDSFNPQSAFAAILTCSQADGACPLLLVLKKSQSLLKTKKHLITHQQEENIEGRPNRYGAFLCILKIKKNNMSATNCTPALNRKNGVLDSYLTLWIFLALGVCHWNFKRLLFLWLDWSNPDDVSPLAKKNTNKWVSI
jgi:hypothetical protein